MIPSVIMSLYMRRYILPTIFFNGPLPSLEIHIYHQLYNLYFYNVSRVETFGGRLTDCLPTDPILLNFDSSVQNTLRQNYGR